jgi:hypothetical protein
MTSAGLIFEIIIDAIALPTIATITAAIRP